MATLGIMLVVVGTYSRPITGAMRLSMGAT